MKIPTTIFTAVLGLAGAVIVHAQVQPPVDTGIGNDIPEPASGRIEAATDGQITAQIQSMMSGEPGLADVTSEVRNGLVRLHGTVASEADKDRAEHMASRIQGVRNVQNRIQVAGDTQAAAGAGAIDARVRANLAANAELGARAIRVESVGDDAVRLTGTVESEAEKRLAEQLASESRSVAEVDNELIVRRSD